MKKQENNRESLKSAPNGHCFVKDDAEKSLSNALRFINCTIAPLIDKYFCDLPFSVNEIKRRPLRTDADISYFSDILVTAEDFSQKIRSKLNNYLLKISFNLHKQDYEFIDKFANDYLEHNLTKITDLSREVKIKISDIIYDTSSDKEVDDDFYEGDATANM